MMTKLNLSRRSLLRGAGAAALGAAVSGCDLLDDARATDSRLRRFMESANGLTYRAQRFLMGPNTLAREYERSAIRQPQKPNGVISPKDPAYLALKADGFSSYRLEVSGLVARPQVFSYADLKAMPPRTQITRHDCVEGWSCIAEWTGVQLSRILARVGPTSAARFVVFDCFDTIERSLSGEVKYYESIDMIDALHPQTILAYGLNGAPLPVENGAPVRLRVERQLGYKHAKYIRAIRLVSSFTDIGLGRGGYWEDRGYEWYAGI